MWAAKISLYLPPTPAPSGTNIHLNSGLITALIIGIPSVLLGFAAYYLSTRATRTESQATSRQIDADAYHRARELYESAITELRRERDDLIAETARLRVQLKDALRSPRQQRRR